ncbi:dioxygenase, partial [Streptomyces sp. NPDC057927]
MTDEPNRSTATDATTYATTDFAHGITDAVVDSLRGTDDPRLRELLAALTRHLHDFVRETEPTMAEWERAIGFL